MTDLSPDSHEPPEIHSHHHHSLQSDSQAEHEQANILTIRCPAGLSGDMLLTGLAVIALEQTEIKPGSEEAQAWLSTLLGSIMPEFATCLKLSIKMVNGIAGWHSSIDLPHVHQHRTLKDISIIISSSQMQAEAQKLAQNCFELLAGCEAQAHQKPVDQVHFHEVGALDSILDICAVCSLYVKLNSPKLVCSPLPVTDGAITCAHGILPAPAPAVLLMLKGLPVIPFSGEVDAGELVTPTAIALLRTLNVNFDRWPAMKIQQTVIAYGTKTFVKAPNGAIFAFGVAN